MERTEVVNNIRQAAGRVNAEVVDVAPKILRPAGIGFGLAALTVDQNWPVVALSFGVSAGSAAVLELRKRVTKRNGSIR